MNWRKITRYLLLITAAVWIVYDFFPFFDPATGDTISEVIAYYALRLYSLPFVFGVLCGHFFFLRDGRYPKPKILLPVALLVIATDVIAHLTQNLIMLHLQTYPCVPLLLGIPFGFLFWPQQKSNKLNNEDL